MRAEGKYRYLVYIEHEASWGREVKAFIIQASESMPDDEIAEAAAERLPHDHYTKILDRRVVNVDEMMSA